MCPNDVTKTALKLLSSSKFFTFYEVLTVLLNLNDEEKWKFLATSIAGNGIEEQKKGLSISKIGNEISEVGKAFSY